MPLQYNLNCYRGDTHRWRFTLWEDAGKTDPADLTGVYVTAQVRVTANSASIVTTLATTVTGNIIDVELASGSSQLLPASAAWDLQLVYPSGDVRTIVAGAVSARADVTRQSA
jgi:hypothetical protein